MVASTGPASTVSVFIALDVYVRAPGPAWKLRSSLEHGSGGIPVDCSPNASPPMLHCSVWRVHGLVAGTYATMSDAPASLGAEEDSVPFGARYRVEGVASAN